MSSNTMISLRPENVMKHLPWRLDSKAALGFILILATFSLVGWLYLTQASAVTATSYRIDELRLELDQIEKQNAALKLEIARLEALPHIESRARELGFEPTTNVRYLPVSNYPMPTKDDLQEPYTIISIPDQSDSIGELEPLPWWVSTLDNIALWLEAE